MNSNVYPDFQFKTIFSLMFNTSRVKIDSQMMMQGNKFKILDDLNTE